MSYDSTTGVVSAPVSLEDIAQATGWGRAQGAPYNLEYLCKQVHGSPDGTINRWAKYRPFLANRKVKCVGSGDNEEIVIEETSTTYTLLNRSGDTRVVNKSSVTTTERTYYIGLQNGSTNDNPNDKSAFFSDALNVKYYGNSGESDSVKRDFREDETASLGLSYPTPSYVYYNKNNDDKINNIIWSYNNNNVDSKIYRIADFVGYCKNAHPKERVYTTAALLENNFNILITSAAVSDTLKPYCLSNTWLFNSEIPSYKSYTLGILFFKEDEDTRTGITGQGTLISVDTERFLLLDTAIPLGNNQGLDGIFSSMNSNGSNSIALNLNKYSGLKFNGNTWSGTEYYNVGTYVNRVKDGYYNMAVPYSGGKPTPIWWTISKSSGEYLITINLKNIRTTEDDPDTSLTAAGSWFYSGTDYAMMLVAIDANITGFANGVKYFDFPTSPTYYDENKGYHAADNIYSLNLTKGSFYKDGLYGLHLDESDDGSWYPFYDDNGNEVPKISLFDNSTNYKNSAGGSTTGEEGGTIILPPPITDLTIAVYNKSILNNGFNVSKVRDDSLNRVKFSFTNNSYYTSIGYAKFEFLVKNDTFIKKTGETKDTLTMFLNPTITILDNNNNEVSPYLFTVYNKSDDLEYDYALNFLKYYYDELFDVELSSFTPADLGATQDEFDYVYNTSFDITNADHYYRNNFVFRIKDDFNENYYIGAPSRIDGNLQRYNGYKLRIYWNYYDFNWNYEFSYTNGGTTGVYNNMTQVWYETGAFVHRSKYSYNPTHDSQQKFLSYDDNTHKYLRTRNYIDLDLTVSA